MTDIAALIDILSTHKATSTTVSTCIKPDGPSISILRGQAEGIHPIPRFDYVRHPVHSIHAANAKKWYNLDCMVEDVQVKYPEAYKKAKQRAYAELYSNPLPFNFYRTKLQEEIND